MGVGCYKKGMVCTKVVMAQRQHDALFTEELDTGLFVELIIKMKIFW